VWSTTRTRSLMTDGIKSVLKIIKDPTDGP